LIQLTTFALEGGEILVDAVRDDAGPIAFQVNLREGCRFGSFPMLTSRQEIRYGGYTTATKLNFRREGCL
jgi:hypothetical protein